MTADSRHGIPEVPADLTLDALQGLIRCPSVNPSLAPEEGHGETRVASWARDWLNERGVESWLEETERHHA